MAYIALKTQDAQNRQFQRLVFAQNRRFLPQPKTRKSNLRHTRESANPQCETQKSYVHGSHVENMSNHAHRRKNPPVTQPPQSGNIGVIFLFCRFHKRDIDGIAIFVRLIRSINAIRKREAMASISTTAQAIPQTPPQTPSHPSMPISSTVKTVPRSGIRDVFDRALAGDADELREGLRRLRTFAEQI